MQDKSEIKKQIIEAIKDKNYQKYEGLFDANYKEKDIANITDPMDYLDFFKTACKSNNVFVIANILTLFDELFSVYKNKEGEVLGKIESSDTPQKIFFQLRLHLFSRSWDNPASTLPIEDSKTAFLVKELEVLGPLFSQFHSLRQIAESRSIKTKILLKGFNGVVYEALKSCIENTESPEDTFNAIKNGTNVLLWSFEKEGDFELATVLKNILLVLSVVGPFIKRLRTGEWFLENSEIAAVRQLQRSLEWTRRHDDGTLLKPLFFNDQDPGIKNSRVALLIKIHRIAQMETWVQVCDKKPTGVVEIQELMEKAEQQTMSETLTKIKGLVNSRLDTENITEHSVTKEYYEVIADVNIYSEASIKDAMTKLDDIAQRIMDPNIELLFN